MYTNISSMTFLLHDLWSDIHDVYLCAGLRFEEMVTCLFMS